MSFPLLRVHRVLLRSSTCPLARSFASAPSSRPSPPTPSPPQPFPVQRLLASLSDAANRGSLPDLHYHYHAVSRAILENGTDPLVSMGGRYHRRLKHAIHNCFDVLCKHASTKDIRLMRTILADMEHTFGMPPDAQLHARIMKALVRRQDPDLLLEWLKNLSSSKGEFVPSREDWHSLLQVCSATRASLDIVTTALVTMRRFGVHFTQETFLLTVEAFHASSANSDQFSPLLEMMKKAALPFDVQVRSALVNGFAHSGLRDQADSLESLYDKYFPRPSSSSPSPVRDWVDQIAEEARTGGILRSVELFNRLRERGCTNSWPVINAIIQHCQSVDDVRYLEESLGFKAKAQQWSLVITNLVRANNVDAALSLFDMATREGIQPDAPMVGPIIRSLCKTTISPPTSTSINQALRLYYRLKDGGDPASTPDADIYQSLLRAISTSPDVIPYLHTALGLIRDMETLGVSMKDSSTAASVIVLLMRNAADASQAIEVYRQLRAPLDSRGFSVVLNAFTKLPFTQTSHLHHLPHYFEILRDMKFAGVPRSVEVYGVLLRLLSRIATDLRRFQDSREEAQNIIFHTIEQAHQHMSLDASLTPDTPLWNQLMDAYQRAGFYGAAYNVWAEMYVSGRYDNASVSIILDTCGFARSYSMAAAISNKLFRSGFVFNQNNWDSWLECLCRCGRLDDALDTLCSDMASRADRKSVNVVLSFARRDGRFAEVSSHIQDHLPHVWQTLPLNEQTP